MFEASVPASRDADDYRVHVDGAHDGALSSEPDAGDLRARRQSGDTVTITSALTGSPSAVIAVGNDRQFAG
ncbi:hypothetical protein Misp02_22760 [Microtetraspora sp. NBRC 16547]|nr:hypothetical protein Misp02_22760 [Microtetraspora sp. NBRC 16547]